MAIAADIERDIALIGRSILHYHIIELLGEGGMGVVYKARDARLDREVAIKFLPRRIASDDRERARFKIEARAAARLSHPNVATIHAIEEVDDEMFIVMEYIEGRELKDLIAAGDLNAEGSIEIATQITDGLLAAHRKGIVHRDIKSSNIMITPDDRVKVMDFGLARIGAGTDLTKSGTTLGTVSYMSPEQVRGEPLDHRSDIWSFGVLLYEMLSGEKPFTGDYEQAVLYSILNLDPKPVNVDSTEAESVGRLLNKALEKDRDFRYQSMAEISADLTSIRREMSGASLKTKSDSGKQDLRPALAVLPFTSIRRDPDMEFLGFALADQIIGGLTYVRGVVVRPSSSVRKYQQQAVDAPTAGRELQVEFILTGYYLKEGDVIRLNVELVETRTNEMRWRESIKVDYENVFQLQDIVSEKVLGGLKVRFSHDEMDRIQADVPRDPLAYEYYLRAVSFPVTLEDSRLAIKMLERSIALDSAYAPAYAELGFRIDQVASAAMLGIEEHRNAEQAFRKALSLNENLLTALWQLSYQYTNVGRSEEAAELIDRMFRVTPGNAMAHFALGYLYRYTGMLEESVREVEKALALDPKNPRFRSAGFTYVYSGDYRKAYEVFDLDRDGTLGIAWKGMSLFLLGEKGRAVEYLDRAAAMEPEGYIGLRHAAISAFIKGKTEEGLRLIRRLESANPTDSDSEHWYLIGNAYGLLGDSEGCLRALRRAIEGGFFSYPCLLKDPLLESIRGDEEFQELLALAKEKHEAFKRKRFGASAAIDEGRRIAGVRQDLPGTSPSPASRAVVSPEVRYCRTEDGASIAFAVHGSGPVLVRVLGWFTHVEMEWEWPSLRLMWELLSENHTVVRYDGRGIGLSSRWDDEFTEETRQLDLDAVLNAVGDGRVALYGISEGGWTAAHYASYHPEGLSHLIIYGAYLRGTRFRPGFDAEEDHAVVTLMRKGWGRDTPEIRQMFTTAYFGSNADPGLIAHFNDMQRAAADGDTAARYQESLHRRGDGREVFARIRTPSLVIHCRDDRIVPFEEGRLIASTIPAAQFLPFPTQTHYFPLDDDVTHRIVAAIDRFTG